MTKKPPKCASQNRKPKLAIVSQIARIVRKHGLSYDDWRYVSKRVREVCELRPAKRPKKLPRVMNGDGFRRFYQVVDQADDVQHSLMLRLLFFTMVRVSELCNIQVADVDLENCKIRINMGKGSKDRYCPELQIRQLTFSCFGLSVKLPCNTNREVLHGGRKT